MLLKRDLFNVLPTATTEEFVRFDQQVLSVKQNEEQR